MPNIKNAFRRLEDNTQRGWEWFWPRFFLAGSLIIVLVIALRVTELVNPDQDKVRLVTDVSASPCPMRLHPLSIKCEVNYIRRANGLRTLSTNHRLRAAARQHAADMIRRRYFAHVTPEGRSVTNRVQAARYLQGARDWAVGENIAWGSGIQGTPRAIVQAWMDSPPHRKVILGRSYREGGAGIVRGTPNGADGVTYVMVLGAKYRKPRPAGWESRST